MLSIDYDALYDTLFIEVYKNDNSYEDEVINNISIFRDFETKEITGYLIFGFLQKYKNHTLSSLPFNNSINYEKDIMPLL